MKRTILTVLLAALLLLSAAGSTMAISERVETERILPESEDSATWTLADFGLRFTETYPVETESYSFMPGTDYENTIIHIKGAEEGPTVFFVCGLHGDETAGWTAGNLLKTATIKAGEIYILAPANRYGAEHNQRRTKEDYDPNRYFPGNAEGTDAEQLDGAIFAEIEAKQPALVMDLHEGLVHTDGTDDLGNSIICQDFLLIGDLSWDIVLASDEENLCGGLTLYGTPPAGSLNNTVTTELGIPVITVETSRGEALAKRVDKQLELVEFILRHEGLY